MPQIIVDEIKVEEEQITKEPETIISPVAIRERTPIRVVEMVEYRDEPNSPQIDLEKIRIDKTTKDDIILGKKINTACRYTKRIFAPYLGDEEIEKLLDNIEEYALGKLGDNLNKITPKGIATIDIYHYGWNIWNHFKCTDQTEIARFLKQTFAHDLRAVDDLETIRKKLRYQDQSSTIQLQNKI